MKATHKLELNIKTNELAEMLASASKQEFSQFWIDFERHMTTDKFKEIAEYWADFNNGKQVFDKFLLMIKYHEVTLKR